MRESRRAGLSVRPSGGLSLQAQERSDKTQAKPAAERSDRRRAVVMIIQRGDPEIAGALLDGMIAGRAEAKTRETSSVTADAVPPDARRLAKAYGAPASALAPGEDFGETVESVEIVTMEQDKWRRVARQVHVAVGRNLTAEDYRMMIVKARCDYAVRPQPGIVRAIAGKLLLAWALIWQGIWRAYEAQDRVLRP